jgi:beta-glucanase (GH16 family)
VAYPQIEDGKWHTFGLLWSKDSYKYYLDGKLMHQKTKAISQINEYIILSLEISDWAGASDITDKDLPDQFEIDYVKVYQKNSIEQNNIKIIR